MIQKNIVEIFTLVLYWIIIAPLIIVLCVKQGWIVWDENDLMTSVKYFCGLALGLAAGYLVVYLIVVLVYLQIQKWTMKVWHNYDTTNIEMINAERAYYAQNDPDMIYAKRQETQSAIIEMEDDDVDGRYRMRYSPDIRPPYQYRRPNVKVHRLYRNHTKPNHRPALPPPPYEEPEN